MRLGSILLFKNGFCYQSYGWNFLRPLGKLQNVITHLDKYLVDDITIIRPIRNNDNQIQLLSDLNEIKTIKSSTPISFGGGIRNIDQLKLLRKMPIERFVFSSSLFNKESSLLTTAKNLFGKQAIIGLIPFKTVPELKVFNCQKNYFVSSDEINHLDMVDEIILYDCTNEGNQNGFNCDIFNLLKLDPKNCIISGGVANLFNSFKNYNEMPKAIAIENSILHREFSKSNYYEKL